MVQIELIIYKAMMFPTYPPDDDWILSNPWDDGTLTEETEEEKTEE
jgi:hypothetical protein